MHLPVKLGGGRRDGGLSRSAWIPLPTCSGEMDRLRCPDFPCDYSNCVIMEVGAEWPSAEGRRYKATVSPSLLSPYSRLQTETAGDCGYDVWKGHACSFMHSVDGRDFLFVSLLT